MSTFTTLPASRHLAQDVTLFDIVPDFGRARRNDPTTSHEAAKSVNVPDSHELVNSLLTFRGPLAQFEAECALTGVLSPSRIRSAFTELEALGKVVRTDEHRVTPLGRRAQVWAVAL